MRVKHFAQFAAMGLAISVVAADGATAQTPPAISAAQLLEVYRPKHSDVEYDIPETEDFPKCRVETEQGKGSMGYVVLGPAGQVLRRITDTNGDRKPDVLRFYRMGLEVYRDVDTNKNDKPDQSRWLNWGGTRWGIDENEDGKIDSWKILSAQEAARIAIEAMIQGDLQAISNVMVSSEDAETLRLTPEVRKEIAESTADLTAKLRRTISASKTLNARSKWVRFDPPLPGLIPVEDGRAAGELMVLENAMAIVQNGEKHDLVMIGEMVRVGEVWKLTQLPVPMEGTGPQTIQLGGILMQPKLASEATPGESMSEDMQKLLAALQKVDEASPAADAKPQQLAKYNVQRADLIEQLMLQPQKAEDRIQWVRQFADGVAAATQTGAYPEGLDRLTALQEKVKENEDLLGYIYYRRLLAEYAVRLKTEDEAKRETAQKWWLEQLKVFAERWPKSEDASDAIAQLAISLELMGQIDDARAWYTRLAKDYERTNAGIRARGALKRLDLTGKPLVLEGKSLDNRPLASSAYKGRVTLVVFWATWAMPFTDDLPKLNEVHKKYKAEGFEILGVNLDSSADALPAYLKQHGIAWNSIRDAGGTDGQLAREYGIVSVPTMFLVDKSGVVAGGIATANLEAGVQALLKGNKLESATRQSAGAANDKTKRSEPDPATRQSAAKQTPDKN
jgi:thiol-disulfide isomerase/thioredoxin/flagellar hook-basal body complex protein FliE